MRLEPGKGELRFEAMHREAGRRGERSCQQSGCDPIEMCVGGPLTPEPSEKGDESDEEPGKAARDRAPKRRGTATFLNLHLVKGVRCEQCDYLPRQGLILGRKHRKGANLAS